MSQGTRESTETPPEPTAWSPSSWRAYPALHQPEWPDLEKAEAARARLASVPPLVFAGEARQLRDALGEVAAGRAFVLQAGDCAESFHDFSAPLIRDKLKILLQMAAVLTYGGMLPVVKVGRIAGQFAKARTSATETVDGVELTSFRGHMVHGEAPTLEARVPDPERMLQVYHQSAATLNLLRAFTKGGFADLMQVHAWNQEFVANSPEGRSHEGLVLDHEEGLTRRDSLTGEWYDCSAHMLWIGERTRQPDGAHVEFFSGVNNPIGCKIGPDASPEDVLLLCERLNPGRISGRLTLISRMGADRIFDLLPPLLRAVREAGHPVAWVCDPMHANVFTTESGLKTRHLDAIMGEIEGFFAAHRQERTWPGGVHLEFTGEDVTECLGGSEEVHEDDLNLRYMTLCDPRLNARQSLDLAFRVAELMRRYPTSR
jgi:3-deoxy-7-phosphoheptulonate synthase